MMPDESAAGVISDTPRTPPRSAANAIVVATPTPRSIKSTESKSLETEAKDLLNRIGVSGVGRRCAEYRPTLDELKSTSFSDYIRGEVLGVPLPGYEFLYIYEDKEGRERKREIPVGQVPPLCLETRDSNSHKKDGHDPTKSKDKPMRTRSQARAIEILKKGTGTTIVPPKTCIPRPKKYQMCWHKLRDGIAKVSLPSGFWAKMDTTGRGRHVSI